MITDESIAEGVRMVQKRIMDMLAGYGVVEIEALGHPFDPNFHNAIEQVKAAPDLVGVVFEVFQPGYIMGDRVLRHSVVKVGI